METVLAVGIACLGFYFAWLGFNLVANQRSQIRLKSAYSDIQNDVAQAAVLMAKNYFVAYTAFQNKCASPPAFMSAPLAPPTPAPANYWPGAPYCQSSTTNATTGTSTCSLSSGVTINLLTATSMTNFSNQYPATIPNDPSYTAALQRCKGMFGGTFYPTYSGSQLTSFSGLSGLYFCAQITATNSANAGTPAIANMQPVLVEFSFSPYDVSQGTALTCNALQTAGTWSTTDVAMLYYSAHWSIPQASGGQMAKSYSGMYAYQNFAPMVLNPSFENPVLPNSPGFQCWPSGTSWSFAGSSACPGMGVLNSSVGFGLPTGADGNQAAILKQQGVVYQQVQFGAGTYTISYVAAQRNCCDSPAHPNGIVTAILSGSNVLFTDGGFTTSSLSWVSHTVGPFTVPAGTYTLQFSGTQSTSYDSTVFLDKVQIQAQ